VQLLMVTDEARLRQSGEKERRKWANAKIYADVVFRLKAHGRSGRTPPRTPGIQKRSYVA
jgi:hypothetical protein